MDDARNKETDTEQRALYRAGMVETGASDCSPAPGNLDTNWEILGNINSVVLSRLMKSRGERRGVTPPGNMLSQQLRREGTQGEIVASNSNKVTARLSVIGVDDRGG
jgi:hypothetical protein